MTHVATLIVDPATPFLGERHLRRVAEVLPEAGSPVWLAPGAAVDVPFAPPPGRDNSAFVEALRESLADEPIDAVVQQVAGRRKRLLLADMDSTLIAQETIDELADALGLRTAIAAITARSMAGEVAFEPSLRERVALLRGLRIDTALRVFHERITYTPGARVLVRTMRAGGAVTAIASGGFTLFTGLVADALGFESHFANTLLVAEGAVTGGLEEPVFGRDAKRQVLQALRTAHGVLPSQSMAVGDGANDLAMLAEAGLGVAFHAKPIVAAAAGARIDHGDLTALLYLQGFARSDFTA